MYVYAIPVKNIMSVDSLYLYIDITSPQARQQGDQQGEAHTTTAAAEAETGTGTEAEAEAEAEAESAEAVLARALAKEDAMRSQWDLDRAASQEEQ